MHVNTTHTTTHILVWTVCTHTYIARVYVCVCVQPKNDVDARRRRRRRRVLCARALENIIAVCAPHSVPSAARSRVFVCACVCVSLCVYCQCVRVCACVCSAQFASIFDWSRQRRVRVIVVASTHSARPDEKPLLLTHQQVRNKIAADAHALLIVNKHRRAFVVVVGFPVVRPAEHPQSSPPCVVSPIHIYTLYTV